MAATVKAQDMIDIAFRQCGVDSIDPANAFIDPYEALGVLNGELAELFDVVLEHGVGEYYRKEAPLTLQSGKSRYDFAADFGISDFYEVIGLDITWSPSVVRSAKLFMESERNRYRRILPAWSQFCDIWYRPWANQLEVMPVPQSSLAVTMIYVPVFTPLVNLTDTFDTVNQWHWFAIWGLCAYIRAKDDDPAAEQSMRAQKESVRARVISLAGRRVEGEPPRVQRTRSFDDEDIW